MNENSKSKKMAGNVMDFTITPPRLKPKRGIGLLLSVLKPLACILGPLTVPAVVYGIEGCTTLFWCILGMGSFTSFLLLTLDIQKVRDLRDRLKINQCGGNIRCLLKASLMLLTCGGGTYAYHVHAYQVFSVCLFITGVITGTFFSDVTAWWNLRRKKNVPYVNFTKDSPKPVRPSFLDLRRKSSGRGTNILPLKRQLSSPAKKFSNLLNCPKLDEPRPSVEVPTGTPNDSMFPVVFGYPSLSSSSGDSDITQPAIPTPTKRRLISPGQISLSPLGNTPKTSAISKRPLEFTGSIAPVLLSPSDILPHQTIPTLAYTNCNVDNRRVMSPGPLGNTPKTSAISKRPLEFTGSITPALLSSSDISPHQTIPTLAYTDCNVDNRRVMSPGPLGNTPKTSPISKRPLEFTGSITPALLSSSDISPQHTIPTLTYTNCNVDNLLSQNFSFFHM